MDKLNEPFRVDIQRYGATHHDEKVFDHTQNDIHTTSDISLRSLALSDSVPRRLLRYCHEETVGAFHIITTAETDACMTDNAKPTTGPTIVAAAAARIYRIEMSFGRILINDSSRQNSQWLQCTLGGAHQIVYGLKRKTSTRNQHIEVFELQSYQTEQLSDGRTKDVTFNLMHEYMKLIAEKVEQGKVYKLERAPITSNNRSASGGGQYNNNTSNSVRRDVTVTAVEHRVTLSEVIDGDKLWPIVNESILKAIDEWALSVHTKKAKQSNMNVVKQ